MQDFLFATGIENSYPLAVGKDGCVRRRDQMKETRHYERWEKDFQLVAELEIPYLRYGPPYYLVQKRSGECNFSLRADEIGATKRFDMEERLERLDRLGITPIIDLCHFGLPAWARGFQDPDWPEKFAEYAAAFAQEFKSVLLYTPINEIYVAANFSGQLENWNERTGSDRGFVRALCNLCRANVRAMEEILKVQSGAVFIQSESSEYFHPETEKDVPAAQFLNSKRFLSLDLSYGRAVDSEVLLYLERNGMPEQDYHFFMKRRDDVLQSCVMGNDYYYTNEHWVDGAKHSNPFHYRHAGEIFGYYVITHQYYERYRMPLMHTETNRASVGSGPDESSDWLQKEWANVLQLKQDGVPIIGFTWYGLVDLVGWDGLLCGDDMKPVRAGLCTLSRAKRRVGTRYRELIRSWRDALRAPQIGTTPAGRPVDVDLVAQQVKSLQRGTFKRGGLRVR